MRVKRDGSYLDAEELSPEECRRLVEDQMDLAMRQIGYEPVKEETGGLTGKQEVYRF